MAEKPKRRPKLRVVRDEKSEYERDDFMRDLRKVTRPLAEKKDRPERSEGD